ncbi:hypothetical protein ACH4SK_34475 [Streptomyces inhibens]|uniref:hypothetical protein n=1 Tax=Streptomyces inhibens TaxID=2293571 RepID=UPI0037904AA3
MDTEVMRHQLQYLTDREVFVSAGHADSELVRTADGWRIAASSLRLVWTRGTPPRVPANRGAQT